MSLYAVAMPPPGEVDHLFEALAAQSDGLLTWEPSTAVRVGLCSFGHPTNADVDRLAANLMRSLAEVEAFQVRFTGGSALDDEGDENVWAGVGGHLDQLSALAHTIADAARREGFAVDRRWYLPRAQVARINATTTAPGLQQTVNRLEAYEGAPWSVTEVALIATREAKDEAASQVVDTIATLPLRRGSFDD